LERGYPRATPWEIFEMLREELVAVEGDPYEGILIEKELIQTPR
jgi:hypothetical protein